MLMTYVDAQTVLEALKISGSSQRYTKGKIPSVLPIADVITFVGRSDVQSGPLPGPRNPT
jgi:hypothetical protein